MSRATVPADPPVVRVSTLELFFDLVFVFAITQVSHLFEHGHGTVDFLRAFFVLAAVWWMYGGYAWLTSNVGTERLVVRLLLLCAMAAFLVIALRIPAVADRHGLALGAAYVLVVLVHGALFTHAPNSSARAILGVLPINLALGALVVISGLVPPKWNWLPWFGAAVVIASATVLHRERDFQLSPVHFVERHGLVVLIALGESVLATGVGAADLPMGWPLVTAVVLGLALAAATWWTYFDHDDRRAERAMHAATGADRARLALYAYYHAHLIMICGIILAAAGVHYSLPSADRDTAPDARWIAIGVATYLVGAAIFRRLLRIGPWVPRVLAAAVASGLAALAPVMGALAQLACVVGVMVALVGVERREPGPAAERPT